MPTAIDDKELILAEAHKPIRPEDHEVVLQNLQGNILKGHGRDHSVHIFLRFKNASCEVIADRLAALAARVVTSAWDQVEQRKKHQEEHVSDATCGNLFLTATGYQSLGFSLEEMHAAFPGADNYFLAGMTSEQSLRALADPPPSTWEDGYKDGQIHALILLANQHGIPLRKKEDEIREMLSEFADILVTEYGTVQRNKDGQKVEHFGFIDGLSEPIFFSADLPKNTKNWNPSAVPDLVLVPDVLAREANCYGSYLVYRKLAQDVARFILGTSSFTQELAHKTGLPADEEYAKAMMVGRFAREGTPLTSSNKDDMPRENNFTYASDSGLNCPVFAHIRATNPRSDKTKRIARRSIPYGKRASMYRLPNGPVGLLFMCFQKSIDDQFAHIQKQANLAHDPIIRQPNDLSPEVEWPTHWGKGTTPHRLNRTWVTLKGGEFFFAPSISFLKKPRKP